MHKFFAKTVFLGKKVYFLPECHSTNEEAQNLITEQSVPEGSLVITDNQTRGKGQRGNKWESEPGKNLTFSLIIKPKFIHISSQFDLNIITSLAIHDTLFDILGAQLKIKWPNDIYYNSSKLAGILIENIIRGPQIEYATIGIGLNVNQEFYETPFATSLKEISGRNYELSSLLEHILIQFEKRYLQLKNGHRETLKDEYHGHMYLYDTDANFKDQNSEFLGRIIGIDSKGKLQVSRNQEIVSYDFKEIEFLRQNHS